MMQTCISDLSGYLQRIIQDITDGDKQDKKYNEFGAKKIEMKNIAPNSFSTVSKFISPKHIK